MRFASPLAFLLLLLLPILVYLHSRWQRNPSLRFSSTHVAAAAGQSLRQRLVHLPLILRILALILLTLALARPQAGMEKIHDVSHGIAIEMVVDRSSSMEAEIDFNGERLSRLEAVKRVFAEFVAGNNDDLAGRPNDLIGMISFARYADTICPLTLAHDALDGFLDSVHLAEQRSEDGTAIGDALALAAARLQTAEEVLNRQTAVQKKTYDIKSKIIILLTDGENNAGSRAPMEAAALAKEWGIKIYTVGVGGQGRRTLQTMFGPKSMGMRSGIDRQTLTALAETTGGVFRMAKDGEGLRAIYQEIDQLEKSEVESVRYVDYKERFAAAALIALALVILETLLANTLFRRIP